MRSGGTGKVNKKGNAGASVMCNQLSECQMNYTVIRTCQPCIIKLSPFSLHFHAAFVYSHEHDEALLNVALAKHNIISKVQRHGNASEQHFGS